jgi:hypothetical protein
LTALLVVAALLRFGLDGFAIAPPVVLTLRVGLPVFFALFAGAVLLRFGLVILACFRMCMIFASKVRII